MKWKKKTERVITRVGGNAEAKREGILEGRNIEGNLRK